MRPRGLQFESRKGSATRKIVEKNADDRPKSLKETRDIVELRAGTPVPIDCFGERAVRLARLVELGLPVPATVAISMNTVRAIASGRIFDAEQFLQPFPEGELLAVRSSPGQFGWGGAESILNVGMNEATRASIGDAVGPEAAANEYFQFVHSYSVNVARLDAEAFDEIASSDLDPESKLAAALRRFEEDIDEQFPQSPSTQLMQVLRCMARAWEGSTARILRQARGAPDDAGLGLIVQVMASGHGPGLNGTGYAASTCYESGKRQLTGRFYPVEMKGRSLSIFRSGSAFREGISGISIRNLDRDAIDSIAANLCKTRKGYADSVEIAFAFRDGVPSVLDARPAPRTARAAVRIAVDLVEEGATTVEDALLTVEPEALMSFLHAQVEPREGQAVLARGIPASPGAATGGIAFSASEALIMAAKGIPCILVRAETGPEDIRGIYTASGVLTGRGGITSHAAVIARGLGVPCVAGASDIKFDARAKTITCFGGKSFGEGDLITVNGTNGEVLEGAAVLVEPRKDDAFAKFMKWADVKKDIGIRANADTPE
ncbi:MAG: PEP-utilizing enzyme, partial [Albidovulum sp.]|nr:PEP-utilizing enzyme [Albidovulum sp.]